MPTSVEMRADRAKIVEQARQIERRAAEENRSLTSEESEQIDRMLDDTDKLKEQIDVMEKAETRSRKLAELATEMDTSRGRRVPAEIPGKGTAEKRSKREIRAEAKREKRSRIYGPDMARRASPEYRALYATYLKGGMRSLMGLGAAELRALQADADVQGGYLIPPMQFVNKLILFVKDLVFIRQLATLQPVTAAQSLGAPALDADPTDADWTPELLTGAQDAQMIVGRRDLTPHPLAKRILVSNKLLRLAPNVENLVLDRLGYKFAVTEEKAFLTGNGAQQPLGVFTASAAGISTNRDVSTGNTSTSLTADGLIEAKYGLKAQYQKTAVWVFHRTTVKAVRKLKDANGQYLWAPGLGSDRPDTILDRPFYMSEYVPNTYTTGLYVGIIGDFSFFWIADSLNMAIQRLDELYAETNQVEYIARRELDAMPVLEEAFIRVKLA